MKKIACLFIGFCLFTNLSAQKVYRLDASDVMETPSCGHLKMGNPGPKEKAIEVNSLYMTRAGSQSYPLWESCISRVSVRICGKTVS